MTETTVLTGPEYAPTNGNKPDRLIIFLHGLGANGDDLISLAPVLSQVFPTAQFLAPNAPDPCDMTPMGLQWFSLQDMNRKQLQSGADAVTPVLHRYLDEQLARFSLTPDRVAIIGFSQGTMLALHAMPKYSGLVAGVLGFSGMLIDPESLADEDIRKPPTLLIHGTEDQVVPAEMSKISGEALKMAGFDTEVAFSKGLGHSIDEPGLRLGIEFLLRAFGDKEVPEPEMEEG
ncbi:MAG: dienelactone hydrolase family protein [Alphaproteobacteria bacterium]|nr:dienelactone hydrolase family protein [Alphaproteobacteria bacterium]